MRSFAVVSLLAVAAVGQTKIAPGDWPMYNRDLAGTRYSPLTQINTTNVSQLKQAWSYKLGAHPSAGSITGGSEYTPIVVGGRMYVTTNTSVAALEPETGRELWREIGRAHV